MNTGIVSKFGGFVMKNLPTILTGLAVGGVAGTAIFAHNGGIKAYTIVEEYALQNAHEQEDETLGETVLIRYEPTIKERLALTWKCYIPAVCMGAATIAFIIAANKINLERIAALAGACSLTDKAFKEYKDKVKDIIGADKEKEIRHEVAQDRIGKIDMDGKNVVIGGTGDYLCYDSYSGRAFPSNINAIKKAENDVNSMLLREMRISLNEVYDALGLDHTSAGDQVGWAIFDESGGIGGNTIEFDIDSCLTRDNVPCLSIDFSELPNADFRYR